MWILPSFDTGKEQRVRGSKENRQAHKREAAVSLKTGNTNWI
jgi:hypothetical protein